MYPRFPSFYKILFFSFLGLKEKDTHDDILSGDHEHIIPGTNVSLS